MFRICIIIWFTLQCVKGVYITETGLWYVNDRSLITKRIGHSWRKLVSVALWSNSLGQASQIAFTAEIYFEMLHKQSFLNTFRFLGNHNGNIFNFLSTNNECCRAFHVREFLVYHNVSNVAPCHVAFGFTFI